MFPHSRVGSTTKPLMRTRFVDVDKLHSLRARVAMLIPKVNRNEVYKSLFSEGVIGEEGLQHAEAPGSWSIR